MSLPRAMGSRGAKLRTPRMRPSVYFGKLATGEGEKKAEAPYTPKYTGAHAQPEGSRHGRGGVGGVWWERFIHPPYLPENKNPA
jgi:hypothetical protein